MKEALDVVALRIECLVHPSFFRSTFGRWNDRFDFSTSAFFKNFVGVVRLVSQEIGSTNKIEKVSCDSAIVLLPRRNSEADRLPLNISKRVYLGRAASSRPSYRVFFWPPAPPEESWCARTIDPSKMAAMSSLGIETASNICSHTSFFDHLSKRL